MPVKADMAAGDAPGRRHQPQHRQGGHRLAAAAFADQAQDLVTANMEIHPIDGVENPAAGMELHAQPLNLKQRLGGIAHWRSRGLKASDSPSASRLKPSTVMKIAAPGAKVAQGATRMVS